MPKQVFAFLGPVGYDRKLIKNFAKNSKTFDIVNLSTDKI